MQNWDCYLDYDERQVFDHLVDAWNGFTKLEPKHNDHINEFRFHIHALQNILAARFMVSRGL